MILNRLSWLKINHPAATLPATFTFLPPNFEQSCEIFPGLESHSSTTDQADDVTERLDASNECPTAIVDCEQSPTMTATKISSCNETPNRQLTKDIVGSHISRENESLTSSENESRTNSSEIGITSPDVVRSVVTSITDFVTPTNKTSSGETFAEETPRGDSTTSKASKSSGHSSNASVERISKYLIQYVPETPKRNKGNLRRVMGQRVLTSAEGLALLQEKEAKKQKKTQEVEQRKRERETKRKEKEEEAKRKASEKQKKTTGRKRSAACTRAVNKKSKSTE